MISPSRLLKAVLISFVLAASAYAVAKLNLFGLESMSDHVADGVYQRITAPSYGPHRKGQRAISVIYLDEQGVDNLKGFGWTRFPPTFDQQWTMFDDILQAGGKPPTAVFADFVYLGQGGSTEGFETFRKGVADATHAQVWAARPACRRDPLIKIACIEAAGGTPMIFARPAPDDLPLFTDVQKAIDGVAVLSPALVRQDAYPTITRYPMPAAQAASLGVHGFDVSPATAMYVAYCLRHDGCGISQLRKLRDAGRAAVAGRPTMSADLSKVFDYPLDVVWGSRPDSDYVRLTKAVSGHAPACRGAGAGWLGRLWEQAQAARGPGKGARQECPYALSLGYDRIVAGVGLEPADLERVLADRLVLVGGHFRASNDWVDSPVHGQAPGVQFHAMALDNLIEAGADYRRNGDFSNAFFDSDLLKSVLIFFLALCGIVGVMIRNSLYDRAVATGVPPRLRSHIYGPLYLGLFAACLGVIATATIWGVTIGHRAPINWIGIGFVALGFLCYAVRETLPGDLCASLEGYPAAKRIMVWCGQCNGYLKFEEERLLDFGAPLKVAPGSAAPDGVGLATTTATTHPAAATAAAATSIPTTLAIRSQPPEESVHAQA